MITTISKGYQLTIPAKMRKKLGMNKGSKVELKLDEKHKKITIEPLSTMTFDEIFAEPRKRSHFAKRLRLHWQVS